MRIKGFFLLFAAAVLLIHSGCSKDPNTSRYKTQNVIVIVVDGARYTETWGGDRSCIPHLAVLLQQGVMCANMYNDGYCFTNAGHTAITTGVYQNINNNGLEYPMAPSFFQIWRKTYNRPPSEAWVIATKDKLEILSDCTNAAWQGKSRPMTNCGIAGLGTGYREDSVTFAAAKTILSGDHPRLALINFKQPDAAGHANDSAAYLQGIRDTDAYIYELWNLLQSDEFYKNKTTLIVTNDHGRHTAGHLDGFVSHTDRCEGCMHIELFAIGPDFKQHYECPRTYSQVDIAATVAELMNVQMPLAEGKVMKDLFR